MGAIAKIDLIFRSPATTILRGISQRKMNAMFGAGRRRSRRPDIARDHYGGAASRPTGGDEKPDSIRRRRQKISGLDAQVALPLKRARPAHRVSDGRGGSGRLVREPDQPKLKGCPGPKSKEENYFFFAATFFFAFFATLAFLATFFFAGFLTIFCSHFVVC
jgi:hypothetical protein